jgi:hypothetical protein
VSPRASYIHIFSEVQAGCPDHKDSLLDSVVVMYPCVCVYDLDCVCFLCVCVFINMIVFGLFCVLPPFFLILNSLAPFISPFPRSVSVYVTAALVLLVSQCFVVSPRASYIHIFSEVQAGCPDHEVSLLDSVTVMYPCVKVEFVCYDPVTNSNRPCPFRAAAVSNCYDVFWFSPYYTVHCFCFIFFLSTIAFLSRKSEFYASWLFHILSVVFLPNLSLSQHNHHTHISFQLNIWAETFFLTTQSHTSFFPIEYMFVDSLPNFRLDCCFSCYSPLSHSFTPLICFSEINHFVYSRANKL